MTSHYVFEPEFCNPAAGPPRPAGRVPFRVRIEGLWPSMGEEIGGKNVQDARHLVRYLMPAFPDLAASNAWLAQRCLELLGKNAAWHAVGDHCAGIIAGVRAAAQTALMPTPPAFDGFVEQSKPVSPICLINSERNRYSVSTSFASRLVSRRI